MSAFIILQPDDAAAAAIIHAACFDKPWPAAHFRKAFQQANMLSIGCLDEGGALAGFVCAQTVAGEADIHTIAVNPVAQGAGHGRALLAALESRLGERGISRIILEVAADNERALRLYQAAGFREDGRRKSYYKRANGPAIDGLLMSKALGLAA